MYFWLTKVILMGWGNVQMMPFSSPDHLLNVTEEGWKLSGHIDSNSMVLANVADILVAETFSSI